MLSEYCVTEQLSYEARRMMCRVMSYTVCIRRPFELHNLNNTHAVVTCVTQGQQTDAEGCFNARHVQGSRLIWKTLLRLLDS